MRSFTFLITIVMFVAPVFAELSFKDIESKLQAGANESELIPLIQQEGVDFNIDLKHLKKMKKADFPDYLIDALVELYGPHQAHERAQRRSGGGSGGFYNQYSIDYFSPYYSPMPYYFSHYLGWANPWFYAYGWSPYYYNYYLYNYSYYWDPLYWGGFNGPGAEGNRLSPNGFRNLHESRIRGQGVRRDGAKVKARKRFSNTSGSRNRSYGSAGTQSRSSTRSSSGSSTRSSSSGSRAVRK